MSDKLAVSAAISIFMMTAYLLFGGEAARAPFGPSSVEAVSVAAPDLPASFEAKAILP